MTIDARASVIIARPDITTGLPERKLNRPYTLQGGPSLSEGGAGLFDFGVGLTTHLGVHRKNHRIHPETGCPVSLECGGKFEILCAAAG